MAPETHEVVIIGGGIAGLSAAIYLGRALRDAVLIDSGKSMARWEPDVQNFLGFPNGITGEDLLVRGYQQAERYQVPTVQDEVVDARHTEEGSFWVQGQHTAYLAKRLLLATGIFHIPPDIQGVQECLGHSMFFCKDCDGYRVQGKHIAIYGANNEAVEYALGMLVYSASVIIVTDDHPIAWDARHGDWLHEYDIPVYTPTIIRVNHQDRQIKSIDLSDQTQITLDALFTTRGDIYFNRLAKSLGAAVDRSGEIVVDQDQRTSVHGLYAAGCVTPANCQLIIAAGQGATAAQAINRDLFEESLATHSLRRFRIRQLNHEKTKPPVKKSKSK